jgi:hypothetical protein
MLFCIINLKYQAVACSNLIKVSFSGLHEENEFLNFLETGNEPIID